MGVCVFPLCSLPLLWCDGGAKSKTQETPRMSDVLKSKFCRSRRICQFEVVSFVAAVLHSWFVALDYCGGIKMPTLNSLLCAVYLNDLFL